MNYIIYGGSISGEIIKGYMESLGHNLLVTIDKKGYSTFVKEPSLIVKNISEINEEIIQKTDKIIVALGNAEEAENVKNELSICFDSIEIQTIHETDYKYMYNLGLELNRIKHKSIIAKEGWFKSLEALEPLNGDSQPIPWYTYGIIEFLNKKINYENELKIFEYGMGNSTLWWEKHAKIVHSVEHDKVWFEKISKKLTDKSYKHLKSEKSEYVKSIFESNLKYDIICVDGIYREESIITALDCLSEYGVILFDNSDEMKFLESIKYLKGQKFKQLEFYGFGPGLDFKWETSIFYREKNIFNL